MDSANLGSHPYQAVATSIIDKIRSGEMAPDARLPSVRQLAKDQGVSPMTAQKALTHLADAGYARVVPGLGYFVTVPSEGGTEQPSVESLAQQIEDLRDVVAELTERLERVEAQAIDHR